MSAYLDEIKNNLIAVAGERKWSDTRESWLSRAAKECGITYRAAKSILYGETENPRGGVAMSRCYR